MVTNRYTPSIGGIETYTRRLAESLTDEGVAVEIYTHRLHRGQPDVEVTNEGIQIRRFTQLVRHEHCRLSPTLLSALGRRSTTGHTLHLHSVHDPITAAAAAVWNGPMVLSPHFHGTSDGSFRRLLHRAYAPVIRRLARRADVACSNTVAEASLFAARTGLDVSEIVVIPSGIDVDPIRSAPAASHGATTRVVVAGRLVAYKRVDRIITAMSDLAGTHDLVVIGDGPERAALQQLARDHGLDGIVRFVGAISDEEVRSHLVAADVVCSASTLESQGIVALEGIAAGAGVLLSDIEAHRQIEAAYNDRTAMFGSTESPSGIADGIRSLSKVRHVDLAAHRLPADWTAVARRYVRIYETAGEIRTARRYGRELVEHLDAL